MQFIKADIDIDFLGKRKYTFVLSCLLILITALSLIWHKGPRYGIDFAGGTVIQVQFDTTVDLDQVKSGLADAGLNNPTVQQFGDAAAHEYLIRTDATEMQEEFTGGLTAALSAATGAGVEIRRVEMVGPQVGADLQKKALLALFYALLFIAIYISGRFEHKWGLSILIAALLFGPVYLLSVFNLSIAALIAAALVVTMVIFWLLQLRYAMGAIVALIHDVTVTVGLFSLLGKEFTLPIIAALLTIIGYSLNDTIIVFDRIRENLRKHPRKPLEAIVNRSVNETLSRTILTSLTTLMVVVTLFLLGGGIIHDFAFAMIVGVLVGTYSSIYVASPILLLWQGKTRKA